MSPRAVARAWAGLVAVAVALVGGLTGCTGDGGVDATDTGFVQGDAMVTYLQPTNREPAPDLAGRLLGGGDWSMAEERGDDVLVVNVWGSWCAPCRAEAQALEAVYEETADQGVQFLGINTRDTDERALAFVAQKGLTYPSVVDDGALQAGFNDTLPVAAIPTTYVIDRQGRVAARVVDEITYSDLLELVERVLAEDEAAGLP